MDGLQNEDHKYILQNYHDLIRYALVHGKTLEAHSWFSVSQYQLREKLIALMLENERLQAENYQLLTDNQLLKGDSNGANT